MAALSAFAATPPAVAETVVFECKVDRRSGGGVTTVYSDAMRSEPGGVERFAVDAAAGRGCLIEGPACATAYGPITVSETDGRIEGRGRRAADGALLSFTYLANEKRLFLNVGPHMVMTQVNACSATTMKVKLPG